MTLPTKKRLFVTVQIVNPRDIGRMLKRTPEISYYSDRHRTEDDPTFLRGLGDRGVLTYSEYLFLLSVITKVCIYILIM